MATFTATLANLSSSTIDFLSFTNTSSDYEAFLTPPPSGIKPPLEPIFGMTDSQASSFMPIILHWGACLFYETIDYLNLCPKARVLQPTDEKRNLVSRGAVLRNVLTMHAIQIIFVLAANHYLSEPVKDRVWGAFGSAEYFGLPLRELIGEGADPRLVYYLSHALEWMYLGSRQFLCFLVFDTWAYWVHWALHVYPTLYRKIHSVHHQCYVTYSFATNYNHPVEGFCNDILGAFISSRLTGLTEREAMVFFCTAQIKAVDDHSVMDIPWNPLRLFGAIFGNDMVYHTIHHQTWGLKKNLGLYFTFWDYLNGTIYTGTRKLGEPRVKQAEKKDEKQDGKQDGDDESEDEGLAETKKNA